ncbi:hypothetical protein DRQ00_05700 [candidate division KSB1 bacterium]|nr:MAG: hypothetical protein DRQ00_05700 [candidate division KSB1 bacterium]
MKTFIDSIRLAVTNENWYGALIIALILPDICGKIEFPDKSTNKRYPEWYDKYVSHKYEFGDCYQKANTIFMTGNDCYALRCALLHEGHLDLRTQKASEKLQRIHFVVPKSEKIRHKINFSNIEFQLEVDKFCLDICDGAEKWLSDVSGNQEIQDRIKKIFKIYL